MKVRLINEQYVSNGSEKWGILPMSLWLTNPKKECDISKDPGKEVTLEKSYLAYTLLSNA